MAIRTRQVRRMVVLGAAATLAALTTGCHVENHKDGDAENVKIATPFGGMSVKTNDAAAPSNLGLDVYPGAVLEKKHNGDNGAADVNMSFGSFHLGVKAVSYTTSDGPDKVMAFYRKSLSRYGMIIQCKNDQVVGTPVRTQDGLTCDEDNKKTVKINGTSSKGDTEFKAGSKQHQHIVSFEEDNGGTRIGLVALDLPGNFSVKEDDEEKQ